VAGSRSSGKLLLCETGMSAADGGSALGGGAELELTGGGGNEGCGWEEWRPGPTLGKGGCSFGVRPGPIGGSERRNQFY
jgi:hypothetical protein